MEEDSTSFSTDVSQLLSNIEDMIKTEVKIEDDIENLDIMLRQLNTCQNYLSPDSETEQLTSAENIIDNKEIYYSHLKKTVDQYHMNSPSEFKRILASCELFLRQQNDRDQTKINILRDKKLKMEVELESLKNQINILKQIQSKKTVKDKKTVENNYDEVAGEIDKKYRECKNDLVHVMNVLYPNDSNITDLLQQLFIAQKRGGSSSYVRIENPDSPLVYTLKCSDIIECNPTEPKEIKFTLFS